jgi:hypothetical protein
MSENEQNSQSQKGSEGILKTAAKAIGSAAGAVASVAGVHGESQADNQADSNHGRLPKKNKSRLPRRAKKAQQHAHNNA